MNYFSRSYEQFRAGFLEKITLIQQKYPQALGAPRWFQQQLA